MLLARDNLALSATSLRAHKLRTVLTVIGLFMGVATLITVMTLVQGANLYVEQKIANLGTNVFQVARTPFAATDFEVILRALKNKHIEVDDLDAVRAACAACAAVGASGNTTVRVRHRDQELSDVSVYGHTANMSDIDTRTLIQGRYFTPSEEERSAPVVLIGDTLVQRFFTGVDPVGRTIRTPTGEHTVIGV